MRPVQTVQLILTNKKGDPVAIEKLGYKKKDDMKARFTEATNAFTPGLTWRELLADPAFLTHLETFDFVPIVYANEIHNGVNVFDQVWYEKADSRATRLVLPALAM